MNSSASFVRRALELIREMWDAILEEEAILEESDTETLTAGPGQHEPSA